MLETPEKPKRKIQPSRRRPVVLILEGLILIVAIVAVGRYLFEPGPAPAPDTTTISAETYYEQGNRSRRAADYERAIEEYTQAIETGYFPLSEAYYWRGYSYGEQGQYRPAISDYERSLSLDPACEYNCEYTYNNLGVMYYRLQDYTQATNYYTRALQVNDGYTLAYRNRALASEKSGNTENALRDFQRAMRSYERDTVNRVIASGSASISATIEEAGQQIVFAFEGRRGQRIRVEFETEPEILVLLFDHDQNALAFAYDQSKRAVLESPELLQDGIYTLRVGAYDGQQTGSFTLQLSELR